MTDLHEWYWSYLRLLKERRSQILDAFLSRNKSRTKERFQLSRQNKPDYWNKIIFVFVSLKNICTWGYMICRNFASLTAKFGSQKFLSACWSLVIYKTAQVVLKYALGLADKLNMPYITELHFCMTMINSYYFWSRDRCHTFQWKWLAEHVGVFKASVLLLLFWWRGLACRDEWRSKYHPRPDF